MHNAENADQSSRPIWRPGYYLLQAVRGAYYDTQGILHSGMDSLYPAEKRQRPGVDRKSDHAVDMELSGCDVGE